MIGAFARSSLMATLLIHPPTTDTAKTKQSFLAMEAMQRSAVRAQGIAALTRGASSSVTFQFPDLPIARGGTSARELTRRYAGATLDFTAQHAIVSSDGLVGCAVGASRIHLPGDSAAVVRHGRYASCFTRANLRASWVLRAHAQNGEAIDAPAPEVALDHPPHSATSLGSAHDADAAIQADNAFAKAAGVDGAGAAFSRYAADDAMLLTGRPHPRRGRAEIGAAFGTARDNPLFTWKSWADVAFGSGGLAVTVGEATIRDDSTLANTKYLTIWRREPDGNWRYAIDLGSARPSDVDVPFEYEDGRVYVPVSYMSARAPVSLGWFILDTGANPTVIDVGVAQRLGLPVQDAGTQRGVGRGAMSIGVTPGIRLIVGDVPLSPDQLVVMPLDTTLAPSSGRAVAGIIGSQFFREHVVQLDVVRKRLRIDPPDARSGADLPAATRVALPIDVASSLPVITAALRLSPADRVAIPLRLVVDLGAKAPLLISEPKFNAIGGESRLSTHVLASLGAGIGGETQYYFTRSGALEVGAAHTRVADSLVVGFSANGTLRSADHDGLLGAPLMARYICLFDYAAGRLWLSPQPDASGLEPLTAFDMSGLFLVRLGAPDSRRIRVQRIVAGSPAETAGVVIGDEVLSVDGRPAADFSLTELRRELRTGVQRDVTLRIRRGSTLSARTLHLRNQL